MKYEIAKDDAEKLYNKHSNYVFRIALLLTKSRDMADDITQETFIRVFRKYSTYDPAKPIEPWIYKIALNIARNMYRKQKRIVLTDEQSDQAADERVEDIVADREKKETLWGEIGKLSFKSREIIILHFYMGMTLKEISVMRSIPLGTCKSRLNFALKTLRSTCSIFNPDIDEGGETREENGQRYQIRA